MRTLIKFIVVILIIIFTFTFMSCSSKDSIVVSSADYRIEKLYSAEFDIENIKAKLNTDYKFCGYDCFVSAGDSGLIISKNKTQHIHSLQYKCGYLIGLDNSYNNGGIIVYNNLNNGMLTDVLSSERCIALLNPNTDTNYDYCYAVTSWNYYGEKTPITLIKITFPTNDSTICKVENICEIIDCDGIAATIDDYGVIYIATNQALYSVTTEGKAEKIIVPDVWPDLLVNSIIWLDNYIYIGTHCGVLQYSTNDKGFKWFPLEYEDVVSVN